MNEIQRCIAQATSALSSYTQSPRLDAEIMLMHVLQRTRAWLYAHHDYCLDDKEQQAFDALLQQRISGLPIAYLTGYKDFWSLRLDVNRHTLIPRPETELLVEVSLELLGNTANTRILELGTGSGAISIALAKERPNWTIDAIDLSSEALALATSNAHKHAIHSITFRQSHWFDALCPDQQYDAIVSNPPYISESDPHLSSGDIRFEPSLALISGSDGLDAIRHIVQKAAQFLKPKGWLLLEHGYNQAELVQALFQNYRLQHPFNRKDLNDKTRVSGAQNGLLSIEQSPT